MILWVSYNNDGGGLAHKIYKQGFPICTYFWDPFMREKQLMDGVIPTVQSIQEGLSLRPDAVIFDSSDLGYLADSLRRNGVPTWGAGTLQDNLEHNRGWGIEVMHRHGIRIPQTIVFGKRGHRFDQSILKHGGNNTLTYIQGGAEECKSVVQQFGGRWVFKPFEGDSSASTFVAESPEEMVGHIDHAVAHGTLSDNDEFLIQKVVKGIELSTEAWYSNGSYIHGSCNATIEEKKWLPRNLGPNTGAQSSVVWGYDGFPTIFAKTFGTRSFTEFLDHPTGPDDTPLLSLHGPLDLNTIVSEEDHQPYALEWTPRMGWNAYLALADLFPDSIGDMFIHAARGQLQYLQLKPVYAYVIQVSIPPYPNGWDIPRDKIIKVNEGTKDEHEITGMDVIREVLVSATGKDIGGPTDNDRVYLRDVHMNEGNLETAGTGGIVCDVTGTGLRIEDARDSAHSLAEQIEVDNKQISRLADGAERAIKHTALLKDWGYEDGPVGDN